jgi:penicillin-binding protein 1C
MILLVTKNIGKKIYDGTLKSLAYLGYKTRLHPLRTSFYLTVFFLAAGFYFAFLNNLPNPYVLGFEQANASTKIYDRQGRLLYTISGGKDGSIKRTFISLADVPLHVKQATLAIEDQNFYTHKGISLRGIARAIKYDFFVRQDKDNPIDLHGGSTITQQLVKNAMLTPEKTIKRKLQELLLASAVEMIYSKDEILEMYFNQVAYGGMAYGIEAAAEKYFGKQAQDLNLAEAALLAGLPQAPSRWSPHGAYPQAAKIRQTQVLNRMVDDQYISPQQSQEAKTEVLAFAPRVDQIKAPHFVLYVKDYLAQRFGQAVLEKGGLHVYTTLDLDIQEMAEQAVKDNIRPIERQYNLHNGAALVTKPKTGEILAMVGSVDFWDLKNDGNVNLTTALRQPGSSVKPITYSYALEHAGFTPSTILVDQPKTYCDEWKNCYSPVNYDGKFKGPVTLKKALAESRNLTAVEVLNKIGVDKLVEQAHKMGIKTWNTPEKYGLSLTLGAAEVRMMDMAVVFGTIANMGQKKELNPIKKIVDSRGQVIQDIDQPPKLWAEVAKKAYAADPNAVEGGEPAMSTFTSWQIIDILSDNYARAGEFGLNTPLRIKINNEDRKVFVKTGTSNEFKDNWTDGCSPDYCVLAWVGNNNGEPMYRVASGITGAAPIWNQVMTGVLQNTEAKEFPMPEGMIEVEVCAANGLLPCSGCPQTKKAFFVPGTEPTKKCYFPSPAECQAKKAQMEAEGKSAEEIVKALQGCPLETPKPNP